MENKNMDMGDYEVLHDVRMPECSLRILRLEPGKAVNRHIHHKTTQIYFILEGEGVATIGGKSRTLGPMQSLRIPTDTPHAIRTESSVTVLNISIPPIRMSDQIIV